MDIETLNKEYIQNIAAVFISNKRNRLTASVLLPNLHSWREYLSVKNQLFQFPTLYVRQRVLHDRNTHGVHIALTLFVRLLGLDDSWLRWLVTVSSTFQDLAFYRSL